VLVSASGRLRTSPGLSSDGSRGRRVYGDWERVEDKIDSKTRDPAYFKNTFFGNHDCLIILLRDMAEFDFAGINSVTGDAPVSAS